MATLIIPYLRKAAMKALGGPKGQKNTSGRPPNKVELLIQLETGAYQESSASNFNALPRPASVLVHGDQAELIKRAETIADVYGRDVVPERLVAVTSNPPQIP